MELLKYQEMTKRHLSDILIVLCIVQECVGLFQTHAHTTCEVTHETDDQNVQRWVLSHKDPCQCSNVRFGGWRSYAPLRPLTPKYADTPMVGDNVGKIRDHYHLNCIALTCPVSGAIKTKTEPGQARSMVNWAATTIATGNHGESLKVVCSPPSGSNFSIGITKVECQANDGRGNSKTCTFDVQVEGVDLQTTITSPVMTVTGSDPQPTNTSPVVTNTMPIIPGNEGYCSFGWDIVDCSDLDGPAWIMVSPEKYVPCDGVITMWNLYPRAAHTLTAIIWRHLSADDFIIVGINTIEVTADQINKPLAHTVPEFEYIDVQAGDMIGWAFADAVIAVNYTGNALIRWIHLPTFSDAISGSQHTFQQLTSTTYYGYGYRDYAIQATVKSFGASCDSTWKLFGSSCYQAQFNASTFNITETNCQRLGGHLASVHSHGEQKFIDALSTSSHYWIGFTDEFHEGVFIWTDSGQVDFINWRPWSEEEPNNINDEDCTIVNRFRLPDQSVWVDVPCDWKYHYVCKKPAIVTT